MSMTSSGSVGHTTSRSTEYGQMTSDVSTTQGQGWLADTRLDFRYTFRSLISRPGYGTMVVLTLALAIGANTAIFSALQAVLLKPLPFRQPDRLVVVGESAPAIEAQFVSPITYDDWKTRNEAFEDLAAFRYWETANLEDATGEPESINFVTATANFFSVLGVQPLIGRSYKDQQSKGGGSEAVISYDLWKRRYNGDPAVIGRAIRVRGTSATVVGVMPQVALNLSVGWGDVWTCLYRYNIQEQRATSYKARYLAIVGRLKPGLSIEQARIRMTTLQHQLWREPTSVAAGYDVRLVPIGDTLTGQVRLGLLALFGAVGIVLLIACANISNLMLARAASRRRETATRLALGASPAQLVRLLLVETLTLAGCGSIAGLGAAWASLILLRQLRPDIPRISEAALTPGVFGFTAAIGLGAALLCSLAPLLELRRGNLRESMNEGGRGGSGGAGSRRTRAVLVACQMALACALLVTGGLLLRSLQNVLRVDPGFRPERAILFDLYLPSSRYPGAAQQTRFYRNLTRSLEETPGVQAAGALLYFPFRPKLWLSPVWVEDAPVAPGDEPIVYYNLVAGNYFEAMGIPLKSGRWPTEREIWEEDRAVVVNEAFARQVLAGKEPIGRRIRSGEEANRWHEVVGIVGDVRQRRLDEPSKPEMYETFSTMPMPFVSMVVRTTRPAEQMLGVVRNVVRQADAGLAVANLAPVADYVDAHTADRRFALLLLGAFAALAVLLGGTGVYSVMSYSVAQRRREIAIRLALGAEPVGVRSMVVRDALRVVIAGTLIGLVVAAVAARAMQRLLFGVGSLDPLTYVAVPIGLVAIAAFAAWLPALRAGRVNPVTALSEL
ncbi:MAG TPA: ABC transporter permease [Vicinamibacterales bacterium]|nr:ABC transporter permease [Vicinamibacterales bacterium]